MNDAICWHTIDLSCLSRYVSRHMDSLSNGITCRIPRFGSKFCSFCNNVSRHFLLLSLLWEIILCTTIIQSRTQYYSAVGKCIESNLPPSMPHGFHFCWSVMQGRPAASDTKIFFSNWPEQQPQQPLLMYVCPVCTCELNRST